jgi:hypothetical protein
MSVRWFAGVVAAIAFVVGVIALSTTVNAEDDGGRAIPCGTGFWSDTGEAHRMGRAENLSDVMVGLPSSDIEAEYAQRCVDAIANRRLLAWPLTVVGLVGVLGALLIRTARSRGIHRPAG